MAPKEKECVISACICCYDVCNLEKILILARGECFFVCFEEKFCCVANDTPFPVGMVKEDGFICKLGLHCCTAGLKTPDMKKLFGFFAQCLCCKCIGQFPFGDKGALP